MHLRQNRLLRVVRNYIIYNISDVDNLLVRQKYHSYFLRLIEKILEEASKAEVTKIDKEKVVALLSKLFSKRHSALLLMI